MRHGLLTLGLLLSACAGRPDQCRLDPLASLPLEATPQALLTTVFVNGRTARMVVDTGAPITSLSTAATRRFGVRDMGFMSAHVTGIGGFRVARLVLPDRFDLGGTRLMPTALASFDLPPAETHYDGLLGMDMMGGADVDFDVAGGRLRFWRATGVCAQPSTTLEGEVWSLPMQPRSPWLSPFVVIRAGETDVIASLDTGASRSAVYGAALATFHPIPRAGPAWVRLSGIGPTTVTAPLASLDRISLDRIDLPRMELAVLDQADAYRSGLEGIILGQDILRRVHVWLSNSSRTLVFQDWSRAAHDRDQWTQEQSSSPG